MPSFRPLTLALAFLPMCLCAQESSTDTTGFRRGQWGVQFGAGFNLANIGVLRFTSPRSAWMLQLELSGEHLTGTRTDAVAGTTSDVADHSTGVSVILGRRFYQAPRHKVRSFQSLGLSGSLASNKQTFQTTTFTARQWNAGLFDEVGAGYWVTPNLSLGATGSVFAGYANRFQDNGTIKIEEHGWALDGVNVLLAIGLYF